MEEGRRGNIPRGSLASLLRVTDPNERLQSLSPSFSSIYFLFMNHVILIRVDKHFPITSFSPSINSVNSFNADEKEIFFQTIRSFFEFCHERCRIIFFLAIRITFREFFISLSLLPFSGIIVITRALIYIKNFLLRQFLKFSLINIIHNIKRN